MHLAGGDDLKGPWGTVVSANLTPDPSGTSYYDEALFIETIRTGYLKGARQLNQIMPWYNLRNLTDDDLKDIFVSALAATSAASGGQYRATHDVQEMRHHAWPRRQKLDD